MRPLALKPAFGAQTGFVARGMKSLLASSENILVQARFRLCPNSDTGLPISVNDFYN